MPEGDEDIYNEKDAEALEEGEEIDETEEGVVEGYEENLAKCALCGKVITGDGPVELEIKGEHFMFCSADHAEKFKKQKK